ncbi:MAG: hypothetical protein ACU0CO_18430, partial [Shimia sp.]
MTTRPDPLRSLTDALNKAQNYALNASAILIEVAVAEGAARAEVAEQFHAFRDKYRTVLAREIDAPALSRLAGAETAQAMAILRLGETRLTAFDPQGDLPGVTAQDAAALTAFTRLELLPAIIGLLAALGGERRGGAPPPPP